MGRVDRGRRGRDGDGRCGRKFLLGRLVAGGGRLCDCPAAGRAAGSLCPGSASGLCASAKATKEQVGRQIVNNKLALRLTKVKGGINISVREKSRSESCSERASVNVLQ